jgi:Protein of unknown function (DUF1579)
MKKIAIATLAVALLSGAAALEAQDAPKETRLLQQIVGEWEYDSEAIFEPGKPALKSKGTESVRAVNGQWVVAENKGTLFDTPFTAIMPLCYDTEKKRHVGTWIDSLHGHMTHHEGTLDETGNTLTLLSEGPNPAAPGKRCKLKDVLELKSKDHKVFTSSMQGEDGQWVTFLTVNYRRKK